jgi:heme-binding NEAT domain protein
MLKVRFFLLKISNQIKALHNFKIHNNSTAKNHQFRLSREFSHPLIQKNNMKLLPVIGKNQNKIVQSPGATTRRRKPKQKITRQHKNGGINACVFGRSRFC